MLTNRLKHKQDHYATKLYRRESSMAKLALSLLILVSDIDPALAQDNQPPVSTILGCTSDNRAIISVIVNNDTNADAVAELDIPFKQEDTTTIEMAPGRNYQASGISPSSHIDSSTIPYSISYENHPEFGTNYVLSGSIDHYGGECVDENFIIDTNDNYENLPGLPEGVSGNIYPECERDDEGNVVPSSKILIAATILNQSGQDGEFKLAPVDPVSATQGSSWIALPTADNIDNTTILLDTGAEGFASEDFVILYRQPGMNEPSNAQRQTIPEVLECRYPEGPIGVNGPLAQGDGQAFERRAGPSRLETAEQNAYKTFPNGASTVLLASADVAADQLSAAPFGREIEAPILLQPSDPNYTELHPSVLRAIEQLGAEEVIILGGEAAVSQNTLLLLEQTGLHVRRIAGDTRYHTAEAIAQELVSITGKTPTRVSQADGGNFTDALTAAGTSDDNPLLLTNGPEQSSLPQATERFYAQFADSIDTILSVGQAATNVADLAAESASAESRVIAEATPFETSLAAAANALDEKNLQAQRVFLASADQFPDGLSAGISVDVNNGDILLVVSQSDIDNMQHLQDFLSVYGNTNATVHVIGGTAAVSDNLATTVANLVISTGPSDS